MRAARFHVYQDASGQYRWRLLAANGRTIADSGEAYTRKRDCVRAVEMVTDAVARMREPAWVVTSQAPLTAKTHGVAKLIAARLGREAGRALQRRA